MENADIYAKLTDVLRDVFDNDAITATPELTAKQVKGWDSLAHIRVVLSVEKAFRVKFSAAEVTKLKNVGDFANLIASKLK
ncbi:MAG TPA: acyl carrier protein [Nevskiaceae bacterium]|nr:acyl carrier protein [Nevskiaceae bacterium]